MSAEPFLYADANTRVPFFPEDVEKEKVKK